MHYYPHPAIAMRDVQLAMLQSDNYNPPFFWAAFVFQGEWNSRPHSVSLRNETQR